MAQLDWGHVNPEDCVLRYIAGPHLYGIEDPLPAIRDEVAVVIEPPDAVINSVGVGPRTHEASGLRLTDLSLREFVRRILSGNLTTLLPLMAPDQAVLYTSEIGKSYLIEPGDWLREQMLPGVVGYLRARHRDLESAVGSPGAYDPAMAFTALRVGNQAVEAYYEDRVTLPVPEPLRDRLRRVLARETDLASVQAELDGLIRRLEVAPHVVSTTPLGFSARQSVITNYFRHWDRTWRPVAFE